MFTLLLTQNDSAALTRLTQGLRDSQYRVLTTRTGEDALALVGRHHIDVVIAESALQDMSALTLMRRLHQNGIDVPVLVVPERGTAEELVDAIQWNVANLLKRCAGHESGWAGERTGADADAPALQQLTRGEHRAHAVARWADAVVPLIYARSDPKTLARWSRCIFVSPGALRNWCRTASISPRRSLVFGRLLRAVVQNRHGDRKLENLLDVVDRRTLAGLLRFAGFSRLEELPSDVETFLERQQLIRDADALRELRRSLSERLRIEPAPPRHEVRSA